MVAGSSAPRTRRTSLSERRHIAPMTSSDGKRASAAVTACAAVRAGRAWPARSSPPRALPPPRTPPTRSRGRVARQQRADALHDVGQRVVDGRVAQHGREQLLREEGRGREEQDEDEREDALQQRQGARAQRDGRGEAGDPDRGQRAEADGGRQASDAAGIARAEDRRDDQEEETCSAARPTVPARRPRTRLARCTGAARSRSKKPPSMSAAKAMPVVSPASSVPWMIVPGTTKPR